RADLATQPAAAPDDAIADRNSVRIRDHRAGGADLLGLRPAESIGGDVAATERRQEVFDRSVTGARPARLARCAGALGGVAGAGGPRLRVGRGRFRSPA